MTSSHHDRDKDAVTAALPVPNVVDRYKEIRAWVVAVTREANPFVKLISQLSTIWIPIAFVLSIGALVVAFIQPIALHFVGALLLTLTQLPLLALTRRKDKAMQHPLVYRVLFTLSAIMPFFLALAVAGVSRGVAGLRSNPSSASNWFIVLYASGAFINASFSQHVCFRMMAEEHRFAYLAIDFAILCINRETLLSMAELAELNGRIDPTDANAARISGIIKSLEVQWEMQSQLLDSLQRDMAKNSLLDDLKSYHSYETLLSTKRTPA
jgi:hypothetical protein